MYKVLFATDTKKVEGTLKLTKTASVIFSRLPIKSNVNLWGKEIYFYVDIQVELEDGKEIVEIGDIAYWPDGPAICIFFGPTPVSKGNEIRPYSKVCVIGEIQQKYLKDLEEIKQGEKITLKPLTSGGG